MFMFGVNIKFMEAFVSNLCVQFHNSFFLILCSSDRLELSLFGKIPEAQRYKVVEALGFM